MPRCKPDMHEAGGGVTISTRKTVAAAVAKTLAPVIHPAMLATVGDHQAEQGIVSAPSRTVKTIAASAGTSTGTSQGTTKGAAPTAVTQAELQLLTQAANNKNTYQTKTGGITTAAGAALHAKNQAIAATLQAMGSPYASMVEADSATELAANVQSLAAEYNQQSNGASASAAAGGDAVGSGTTTTATTTGSTSASGGTASSGTASSGTTTSGATSIFGSLSSGLSNLWTGLGNAVNTVTGSTGQTRALQWENILIPVIVIVGIIVWMVRGGFKLGIQHRSGRAA